MGFKILNEGLLIESFKSYEDAYQLFDSLTWILQRYIEKGSDYVGYDGVEVHYVLELIRNLSITPEQLNDGEGLDMFDSRVKSLTKEVSALLDRVETLNEEAVAKNSELERVRNFAATKELEAYKLMTELFNLKNKGGSGSQ